MDKVTIEKLELEIEEINKVQDEGENLDTIDGFRKFIKKQLHKLCSSPRKHGKSASGASSYLDGPGHSPSNVGGGDSDDASDVYDFSFPERGLAIIINNEDFSQSKEFEDRPGSTCDSVSLYRSFKNLGFVVWVKKNLTAWQMLETLKSGKDNYNHANADCFVCAILSHGHETLVNAEHERLGVRKDLLFGTDGKSVATSTVVEMFSDAACPKLKGKPRLFFMQACRGEKYDDGTDIAVVKQARGMETFTVGHDGIDDGSSRNQSSSHCPDHTALPSSHLPGPQCLQTDAMDANPYDSEGEEIQEGLQHINLSENASREGADMSDAPWVPVRDAVVCPSPLYKDSLIMYATPPGHFAWRRTSGSWFIQSLCAVLDNPEISNISLLRALAQVVGIVAKEYQSNSPGKPHMHLKKETPVIESMLVKDVFFTPK